MVLNVAKYLKTCCSEEEMNEKTRVAVIKKFWLAILLIKVTFLCFFLDCLKSDVSIDREYRTFKGFMCYLCKIFHTIDGH